jgi:hypothetical protein
VHVGREYVTSFFLFRRHHFGEHDTFKGSLRVLALRLSDVRSSIRTPTILDLFPSQTGRATVSLVHLIDGSYMNLDGLVRCLHFSKDEPSSGCSLKIQNEGKIYSMITAYDSSSDIDKLMVDFGLLPGALVGRGPEHPSEPDDTFRDLIAQLVSQHPFLEKDPSYLTFLTAC